MNRSICCLIVVILSSASSRVMGQIVQLPTIQIFSVGTTVMIPDRGSAYLGGVDRAVYSSSTRGVPGLSGIPGLGRLVTNRGIGSEVSSSGLHASATIIDLEEMDKAVLAEAAARRGVASSHGVSSAHGGRATNPAVERKAAFLAKHVAKTQRSQLRPPPPKPSQQRQ